jgi:hypothetical protein
MARNSYIRDEIVLCIYYALFDGDDIGVIVAIATITNRSSASIKMKIQNIVYMLDELKIKRNPDINALSGKPPGESGRMTNLEIVAELVESKREDLLKHCNDILGNTSSNPDEVESHIYEGAKKKVTVNVYETILWTLFVSHL